MTTEHELDKALSRIAILTDELEQTKMRLGAERSHVRSLQSRLDTAEIERVCRQALHRVVVWLRRPYHEMGGTMTEAQYDGVTRALTAVIGNDLIAAFTEDAA